MLVLSRRPGESVIAGVGKGIRITAIALDESNVLVGLHSEEPIQISAQTPIESPLPNWNLAWLRHDEALSAGPPGNPEVLTIENVDVRIDKVRLGFQLPSNLPLHRHEVYMAIQREMKSPDSLPDLKSDVEKLVAHFDSAKLSA